MRSIFFVLSILVGNVVLGFQGNPTEPACGDVEDMNCGDTTGADVFPEGEMPCQDYAIVPNFEYVTRYDAEGNCLYEEPVFTDPEICPFSHGTVKADGYDTLVETVIVDTSLDPEVQWGTSTKRLCWTRGLCKATMLETALVIDEKPYLDCQGGILTSPPPVKYRKKHCLPDEHTPTVDSSQGFLRYVQNDAGPCENGIPL